MGSQSPSPSPSMELWLTGAKEWDREVTKTLGRFRSVAARTNNDYEVKWPISLCLCVCMLLYRADLGDTGKHPEPKNIFDFEPGKGAEAENHNQVRDNCCQPSLEHLATSSWNIVILTCKRTGRVVYFQMVYEKFRCKNI